MRYFLAILFILINISFISDDEKHLDINSRDAYYTFLKSGESTLTSIRFQGVEVNNFKNRFHFENDSFFHAISLNKNLKKLDISGTDLREMPNEIFELKHLTNLNLSGNNLTKINTKISCLKKLKVLYLGYNQIQSMDPILRNTNIWYLSMSNNQIKEIPKNIHKLYKLETLFLGYNKIKIIPSNLRHIKCLEDLHLRNNLIDSIPEFISQYNDFSLIVYKNKINYIPRSFCKNFRSLYIHCDPTVKVPNCLKEKNEKEFSGIQISSKIYY